MTILDLSQVAGIRLADPVRPARSSRMPGARRVAAPQLRGAPAPEAVAPVAAVPPPPAPALDEASPAPPQEVDPGPSAAASPEARPAPPAVLIVDDNVRLAQTVAAYMEIQGFRAHPAHSAEEALFAAQRVRFDLVLLDINMPGMDGLEVCRRLIATAPGMRVLMVTGRDSAEDPLRAAAVGARALLTKPISLSALRDEMIRALST
jgi:CheY-like chemotaxis protein